VKTLGNQQSLLETEDLPRPVTGIISAPPGVIQDDILGGDSQADSVGCHGAGLVVIHKTIIAAHEDFFDFA